MTGSLFAALAAAGFDHQRLPAQLEQGKVYRLPAPGRKQSNRSGWVQLVADGVAVYGDWSTGERHTWRAASTDRAAHRPASESRPRTRPKAVSGPNPAQLWEAGRLANDAHPYLVAKGVPSHGLRVDQQGRLLVPVRDLAGRITGLQRIDGDGDKRFTSGSSVEGGFYVIDGALPRVFAEGYATAATVHAATGRTCVVAFNAGNLTRVVAQLAEPGDAIAADNDNAPKPGDRFDRKLETYGAGHKAAHATGLPFYMPHRPGADFNDLGTEATAAVFAAAPASAAPIFDAWHLERIELKGTGWKQWAAQLGKVDDPAVAAAMAYTVAARLFMSAPVSFSLAGIRAQIEHALPAGVVHPVTLDRIMARLDAAMAIRKAEALAPVTIPADVLARHDHRLVDELPMLTADDYQGVVVVRAPMGSGKTQRIGAPFARWAQRHGVCLAICHRVSLVEELAQRLGLTHYGDVDREVAAFAPSLATCLPSITLKDHENIVDRAGLLFVDEVAQVLRFLSSESHCRTRDGNNEAVFERLRELVARARCVIVADAGADRRTIEFLEACRPGERFRIIEVRSSAAKMEDTYYTGGDAPAAVVGECLAELAAGGRVWIAVESKGRARQLGAFFADQGFSTLAVHADNKGEPAQAAFLADPERESARYEVVIASPVIGSGVSIEHRAAPHFTMGAFIGGGHRITPADAAQALRRVRYLTRYVLGLIPNTRIGRITADAILTGWREAAQLEGAPAEARPFDRFVAGIKADESRQRDDFAAGLLWQLSATGWTIQRADDDTPHALAEVLREVKLAQEAERFSALLSAPAIDDAEGHKLENRPNLSEAELVKLEAWRIRRALGVEHLDEATIEFWDNGEGLRRVDRFIAWQGVAAARDDRAEALHRRRYGRAMAKAYSDLFAGFDLSRDRITETAAAVIVGRAVERRFLLARLGIVPKSWGVWHEDRRGRLLPFREPKNPRQELATILERMGLEWRGIRARVSTPALSTLGNRGEGGYSSPVKKLGRVYQVTPESLAAMAAWAERRNAARSVTHVVEIADRDFWRGLRLTLIEQAHRITARQAEAIFLDRLNRRGASGDAYLTALWLRDDLLPRLAAA